MQCYLVKDLTSAPPLSSTPSLIIPLPVVIGKGKTTILSFFLYRFDKGNNSFMHSYPSTYISKQKLINVTFDDETTL